MRGSGLKIQPPAFSFACAMIHLRLVNQGFTGNTSPVDTRTAQVGLLKHQNLFTCSSSNTSTGKCRGTGTKNNQIKISGHLFLSINKTRGYMSLAAISCPWPDADVAVGRFPAWLDRDRKKLDWSVRASVDCNC